MKIELCLFAAVSAFVAVAAQGNGVSTIKVAVKSPQPLSATKALGLAGERMDACIRNQMSRKDCDYLASPFRWKDEKASWGVLEAGIWQNEFWGKYMHAAVPLADYCHDEGWKRRIGESVAAVIATQMPDGYIGNYKESVRCTECDVWGAKYVMLGLLHWYDSTGDKASLEAAKRVC